MKKRFTVRAAVLVCCLSAAAFAVPAQKADGAASTQKPTPAAQTINWRDALKQSAEWYASDEAVRVADNVLLYQHDEGGWSKNIDMARVLTEPERAELAKLKAETGSNIDNGATYTQLIYLARVYTARKMERHREAFLRGFDYLLKAQYENGGWPQYYPLRKGYYSHVTFNDSAMVNVLRLLRDVARKRSAYRFVDEDRRLRAEKAVAKGIELILKTQVVIGGKRTIWGAQHDEVTLAPAPARKFEPASLSAGESVGVVRFLLGIENPDARIVEAVESAVAWFKTSGVCGLRWVERRDASKPGGYAREAVADPKAPPIWARFYEIGTNRPVFAGRDGIVRYNVNEIDEERRNGYGWYVEEPAELLEKDYPAWRKKWRP
ncbi:MAG TPA: pectate lyase [Pyrinomonadaceae bacterium]|jgi:PelA/Pel-15E family pectate lyase